MASSAKASSPLNVIDITNDEDGSSSSDDCTADTLIIDFPENDPFFKEVDRDFGGPEGKRDFEGKLADPVLPKEFKIPKKVHDLKSYHEKR